MFFGSKNDNRVWTKQIEVYGGCPAHAGAGARNGVGHYRGFGHAKAGPAIGLRHCDPKPAPFRDGFNKVLGKSAIGIPGQPIGIIKLLADLLDGRLDGLLFVCEFEVHWGVAFILNSVSIYSASCLFS